VQFFAATRHFDENEKYILKYCFKPGQVVSSVRLGVTVIARATSPIAKIILARLCSYTCVSYSGTISFQAFIIIFVYAHLYSVYMRQYQAELVIYIFQNCVFVCIILYVYLLVN
jgi:hypothetical protein